MTVVEHSGIVDVFFGFFHYVRHCFNGFNGIFAGSRFARKHNSARAVVNRVCNVGNFGAGGARVVNHRFEHFGCGNNALAEQSAFCNEHFLNGWQFGERNFNAQIASAYHDALALGAYFVDVVYSASVFDFCDYAYFFAAVGF